MSYQFPFEKLEVWQESRGLVKVIYVLTAKFPDNEKFGLVNQMRRCSISICSNIAEGSGRRTGKDQGHFYQMALSSAIELLNQLILSNDLEFIDETKLTAIRPLIEKITNQLNSLRKSALTR